MAATLDTTGLLCPLPVLRANKMLRGLAAGEELRVLATDAAAPKDFESYCRTTGHVLVAVETNEGRITIVIRKAG